MNVSSEKLELELNYILSNYMFEIITIPKLNKLKQEITELFHFYNYKPDKYVYIYVQNRNVNISLTDKNYEPVNDY